MNFFLFWLLIIYELNFKNYGVTSIGLKDKKEAAFDVEDERDDGQSLSLYDSETDIVPPEIDEDPTDENEVEFDRPEDLEDLETKVVFLDKFYFDGIEQFDDSDSLTSIFDHPKFEKALHNSISDKIHINESSFNSVLGEKNKDTTSIQTLYFLTERNLIIHCNVSINKESIISYTWYKNNESLLRCTYNDECLQITTDVLELKNVSISDFGDYKCNAQSSNETISIVYHVIIEGRPFAPTNFNADCNNSANVIILKWLDIKNNLSNTDLLYKIYFSSNLENEDVIITKSKGILEFNSLPGRVYKFRISTANNVAESEMSINDLVCNTMANIPYKNPNIYCTNAFALQSAFLNISWELVKRVNYNGANFHYNVFYKEFHNPAASIITIRMNETQSYIAVKVEKIAFPYLVAVQAANEAGVCSEPLRWRLIYSGDGVPEVVIVGLEYKWLHENFLLIKWKPVNADEPRLFGFLKKYRLRYWSINKPEKVGFVDTAIKSTHSACSFVDRITNKSDSNDIQLKNKRYDSSVEDVDDEDIAFVLLNITYTFMSNENKINKDELKEASLSQLLKVNINNSDICFTVSVINSLYEGPRSQTLCTTGRMPEAADIKYESGRHIILILVILSAITFILIFLCIGFLRCYKEHRRETLERSVLFGVERAPFLHVNL